MKRVLLVTLCSGFALLGAWAVVGGGMQLLSGIQSQNWPAITAEVVSSEARYSGGRRGGRYALSLSYRYHVSDVSYQSSGVRAVDHTGTKEEIEARASKLSPGSSVTIYYDPMNPSVAYLERGVEPAEFMILIIGLVIFSLSFGLIVALIKKKGPIQLPVPMSPSGRHGTS